MPIVTRTSVLVGVAPADAGAVDRPAAAVDAPALRRTTLSALALAVTSAAAVYTSRVQLTTGAVSRRDQHDGSPTLTC